MRAFWRENILPVMGLFTSIGTLLCCALPVLFVTLGMGAALAGLLTTIPFLITMSEHKGIVFGVAGAMIVASAILQWVRRHAPCPVDKDAARACLRLRRASIYITAFAGAIYVVGVFFAFIAPKIFY